MKPLILKKALSHASELALKQLPSGRQLVLKTDASSRCDGYALSIEDNPAEKNQITEKNLCACDVRIENFLPCLTQNAHLLERNFYNLLRISLVCTHSVVDHKTNNCSIR